MGLLSQLGSFENINRFARALQGTGGDTLSSSTYLNPEPEASYTTNAPGYDDLYNEIYGSQINEFDKYIDELLGVAQGDYDYASKWIENEYKIAMGNDDQERQRFLKSVANELESKVGTIAYDYKTGKYRTEQDKEIALKRLDEDEASIRKQRAVENEVNREEQSAGLNQRGLMSGTRDTTTGLGAKFIDRLEQQISDKEAALNTRLARERGDIELSSSRGLEDLTTAARRGALGTQMGYDKGKEGLVRALENERKRIEREKYEGTNIFIPQYADTLARQKAGLT